MKRLLFLLILLFPLTTFAQYGEHSVPAGPRAVAEQAADPSVVSDIGWVYSKDTSGVTELFYEDDTGNVTQITTGGTIGGGSITLTDNLYQFNVDATAGQSEDVTLRMLAGDGSNLQKWQIVDDSSEKDLLFQYAQDAAAFTTQGKLTETGEYYVDEVILENKFRMYVDPSLEGSGQEATLFAPIGVPTDSVGRWAFFAANNGGTVSAGTTGLAGGSVGLTSGDGSAAKTASGADGGDAGAVYIYPGAPGAGDGAGDDGKQGEIYLASDPLLGADQGRVVVGYPNELRKHNEIFKVYGGIDHTKAQFYDEMWSGVDPAWATRVTTGSAAAQNAINGRYRITTGATATNEESLDWNDICPFVSTQQPSIEIRLNLQTAASIEAEIGLIEASGGGDDDYIRFKHDASGDTSWDAEVSSGGATTTASTSTASENEMYFKIKFASDTSVEFYINSELKATLSSNVPTVQLQPYILVKTEENASKYIDIDYVKIWQDRN